MLIYIGIVFFLLFGLVCLYIAISIDGFNKKAIFYAICAAMNISTSIMLMDSI